ncbi:DUF6356 family protein [Candidatus Phycosocius spiralis]|uniref:Capsule biosynthesis protein n=1 Tax=Candidatus Phycosocius spiralis TaxID=2815099 RepID=A0ABQ4PUA5_9PROT|nr:DUF6356 family protein [Candidatus Phycosocius spiralis]GIU66515.1 hypothetical protein PsB1_0669 [Candidatus Phycosocius spiralis]
MFKKLFVDHPSTVGETYSEHFCVAFGFGFKLLGAALACMIHGLIPGLFKSTGSATISCLHEEMVTHRDRRHHHAPKASTANGKIA